AVCGPIERCAGVPPADIEKNGEHPLDRYLRGPLGQRLHRAVSMNLVGDAVRGSSRWILAQASHLQLELLRQQEIVAVEVLKKLPPGGAPAALTGQSGPPVLAMNATDDLRMTRCEGFCDGRRSIGGPVVHDHNLDRAMGLSQDALDRLDEK